MAVGIRTVVDGPLPVAPPHTLIARSQVVTEPDERFGNGLAVRGYPCGVPGVWDPCSSGAERLKSSAPAGGWTNASTFVAVLGFVCGSPGLAWDEYRTRAAASFAAREHVPVELEFWTGGLFDETPHLASDDADTVTTTAEHPVEALAALEDALVGRGVIHMRSGMATILGSLGALALDAQGRLVTINGNIVVPGQGYPGTGPGGEAPDGSEWLYATGEVAIRRGDVVLVPGTEAEALDRATNDVTLYAERDYVVAWDACNHLAAEASRTSTP